MSARLEEMLKVARAATKGPTAMPGEQRVIDDEIYVTMLLAYQQADMDGTMVLASRQAIHETVDALRATKAKLEALPKVCDGLEQDAFEQWAISEGYDMSQHPLHWLFLHPKTSGARQGWKAAIEYCLAALTTKETTDATSI